MPIENEVGKCIDSSECFVSTTIPSHQSHEINDLHLRTGYETSTGLLLTLGIFYTSRTIYRIFNPVIIERD